jgi:inosine-uridine nucleoside N-ribohydrolase
MSGVVARPVVLDVDTGTDDAVAIMLATLHPALELVAITTVNGNATVDVVLDNTLRVLDLLGVDVPVYRGAGRPWQRPDFPVPRALRPDRAVHGRPLPLPAARSKPAAGIAHEALVELAHTRPDELTVVTTAPLTNLALALEREPDLPSLLREVVTLAGIHAIGNVTPAADFNTWADPEAARAVIGADLPGHLLIPLDTSQAAPIDEDACGRLEAAESPAARAAALLVRTRIDAYRDRTALAADRAAPVHDAFAVATLIEPALIERRRVHVDVETRGELTTGRTVIDFEARGGSAPNLDVAVPAEAWRFEAVLLETLTG